MFRLEGIDHIALAVGDVERSVQWYVEVLGLERRFEEEWGDYPAVVGVGDTSLALFPDSEVRSNMAPRLQASGFRHVAFRVDQENFSRAIETLADRGIQSEMQDHGVARSIYFRDPDGYQLEITTYEV